MLAHAPRAAAREPLEPGADAASLAAAGKSKEPAGPAVTFTGFHVADDGTSRLTVDLSAPVPVQANVSGSRAEYLLVGATIPLRNNKNPLLTKHFQSLVTSARLVPELEGKPEHRGKGKHKQKVIGVRVVVEMREDATPQHHLDKSPNGTATLVIDFPKPKKAPAPEPDEPPPPAAPKS